MVAYSVGCSVVLDSRSLVVCDASADRFVACDFSDKGS